MGYMGGKGRRSNEYASKSSHSHIIRNPSIKKILEQYTLPNKASEISLEDYSLSSYCEPILNPIKYIVAFDGGYQEVVVRSDFPSSTICFFQFGILQFKVEDLESLEDKSFISPEDIGVLKSLKRFQLILPTKNLSLTSEVSLTHSIRRALYDFFMDLESNEDSSLMETLHWFVFEQYNASKDMYNLASHPSSGVPNVLLDSSKMKKDYTWDTADGLIYLTDVFRLHEAVDDELGAGGILAYVMTTIEQLLMVHFIRMVLEVQPSLLDEFLFIKDGPLAFFGQTANMHKPMRALVEYLIQDHNIFMAGLEKSGAFVDHAHEISTKMRSGSFLLLSNDYIYKYIIPGKADSSSLYGKTTYYSQKLIFKTEHGSVYVMTVPVSDLIESPKREELHNLEVLLANISKLRCDMYDDALIPVALVNKLISIANHPSSQLLTKFAIESIR